MKNGASARILKSIGTLILCLLAAGVSNAARDEDPPCGAKLLPQGIAADTTDIVDSVSVTTIVFHFGPDSLRIPYFGNRAIEGTYSDVSRAIIVINGTLRNADDYYKYVLDAGVSAGHADSTTLIIAPQFLTAPDLDRHALPEDYLYWSYMGWRQGDQSLTSSAHPRPALVSSFALTDSILLGFAERLPNLKQIVVAGHSAGGQFLNRYAAGTTMHQIVSGQMAVPIRYIVSNPSTYMYLNPERWIEGTGYDYAVPSPEVIADCPGYDDYKYGLQNLNPYMDIGAAALCDQYSHREVVYLLGGADTDPNSYYLDKDCPAMLQGSQRLERGMVYTNFLIHFFGGSIFALHELSIVPGIGHDGRGMFNSVCGLHYLYDYGMCDPVPPMSPWSDATTALGRSVSAHGLALGDYDGDGDQDVYWPVYGSPNKLHRNDGGLLFGDVTVPPLNDGGNSASARWCDYDNDGKPDLYLLNWGATAKLFHNAGGGVFYDVTAGSLGITGNVCDFAWGDVDNDGDVDIYVTRTNGQSNVLLRNDWPAGFVDATVSPLGYAGESRGVVWGDYDQDGDLDLYIAANLGNRLFRNNGGGAFSDVTSGPLGNSGGQGSGAAWGDYDNDGDLDLYLANRGHPNKLLRNDGAGLFSDATSAPLNDSGSAYSATWGDYDNDGWLDIFVSNRGGSCRLFHNSGNGQFTDATDYPLDRTGDAYGAAWDDIDGDGDLDLVVATGGGNTVKVVRNNLMGADHWMCLSLHGVESNESAVGARIRIVAGGVSRIRTVGGDSGYLSQNSDLVEFGLGPATVVDSLEIDWPCGIHQVFTGITVDRRLDITESSLPASGEDPIADGASRLGVCFPNPFHDRTSIDYELKVASPLMLRVYDPAGRLVRSLASEGALIPGRGSIVWDGRCDSGLRAPAGVYLCRLSGAGFSRNLRVVLVD